VAVAALDQEEAPGTQRVALAVDARDAAAGNDEQPLVGAVVPIPRIPLRLSGPSTIWAACERRLPRTTRNPSPKRSVLCFMGH
jgi:hypothetical protein